MAPGATARVEVALNLPPPSPPSPPSPGRSVPGALKWLTLAGGVLAVGAGAALIALDGRGSCRLPDGQRQCANLYDTRTGGIVALAGGGALVVTSVILFVVHPPRH